MDDLFVLRRHRRHRFESLKDNGTSIKASINGTLQYLHRTSILAISITQVTTASMEELSPTTAVLDQEHPNRAQSRLCALSEEVIVEIMYRMREADLYFMRHVSHLFFRLFREKRFGIFRDKWEPSYFNFSRHQGCACQREVQLKLRRSLLLSTARAPQFLFNASHANLCQPCLQRIPDRTELKLHLARYEEKLWCSGCRQEHQRLWFSREQLFKLNKRKKRRCILWEGRVRLCSHVSLTWGHVRHWVEGKHNSKPDGFAFLECKQCFNGVDGAKPPKIEYSKKSPGDHGAANREIGMRWAVPLSAVDDEAPGQHGYDQLLCPHVTWTEVRSQANEEYWRYFTCRSCNFKYLFSSDKEGTETFVQGRRLLWSNVQDENKDSDSRIQKVRLLDPDSYEIDTSLSKNVLWCDSEGCLNAYTNPNFHFDRILSEYFRVTYPTPHSESSNRCYTCQGMSTTHFPWPSDVLKEFELCSCQGVKYVVDYLHARLCDLHARSCEWQREELREQYDKYPWLFLDYLKRGNDT